MKKLFALLVMGSLAATSVMANEIQEPAAVNSEAEVAAVAEAPAQAAEKTAWEKVLEKLPKVSGYLQTGWNYNSLGRAAGNNTSSFQAKRLRLILDGNITSKATVRIQIEAFSGIAGTTNGRNQKTLQVMDAFATYKFSDAFQLRAGQFYTPMGYENYDISPATLETVDFSNICYRQACRNAIGYDYIDYGRDLGIMVLGNAFDSNQGFKYLSYNLALTNGALPLTDDNNKSKDLIAAVTVRPFKYFNIKAAYNYGEYKGLRTQDITAYQKMNRAIFGAWYNDPNGLDLRAEYGLASAKHDGVDYVKESGFYVLAAYHFGKWLPVVRYDFYKDDLAKSNYSVNYNRVLLGTSWQPCKIVKLQANYLLSLYKDEAKAANGGKGNSSQIQIMGIVYF